ncbi:MAG: hypothetical protein ABIR30_08600 [Chitinophagaceae bacterium]
MKLKAKKSRFMAKACFYDPLLKNIFNQVQTVLIHLFSFLSYWSKIKYAINITIELKNNSPVMLDSKGFQTITSSINGGIIILNYAHHRSTSHDLTTGLSTAMFKMLIKYLGNIFWLMKILYNIVLGIYFPVLTNPSI